MKHKDTLRREAIERLERSTEYTAMASTRRTRNGTIEAPGAIVERRKAEAARLREKFGSLVK